MLAGRSALDEFSQDPTPRLEDARGAQATLEPWTIRPYRSGDEEQIVALFKKVFGFELSLQRWRWKFRENPGGEEHIYLAVTKSGRIVGQYAGLPVLMNWDGETLRFAQVVDAMVDPEFRAGLKKPGMFVKLAAPFIEAYRGLHKSVGAFGFPPLHHLRIGRLLHYIERHRVEQLVRPLDASATNGSDHAPSAHWIVEEIPAFDARADRLWARCRPELPVVVIRDARYLNWRYAQHPEVRYRLLVVRRRLSEEWAGLAVLRLGIGQFGVGEATACLMDWLVPIDTWWPAVLLLEHCEALAKKAGMVDVQSWFRPGSAHWQRFIEHGFRPEPTPVYFVAGQAVSDIRLDWGCDRWYYTMGDADLF